MVVGQSLGIEKVQQASVVFSSTAYTRAQLISPVALHQVKRPSRDRSNPAGLVSIELVAEPVSSVRIHDQLEEGHSIPAASRSTIIRDRLVCIFAPPPLLL